MWRALNRLIASCFERPRSRQSLPRSPSKIEDLTFRSEKVINLEFLEPLRLSHTYAAPYGAKTIKVRLDESFIDSY